MQIERVDALVVGGGQAGLAISEHLGACGVRHVVLERHRIAERWRSERWDSFVANGPAWHDRFPGLEFSGVDPDAFAAKQDMVDYFVAYAKHIGAPLRCGVNVESVEKAIGRPGFDVRTSDGLIKAESVIVATGAFQRPVVPAVVPDHAGLMQMHSNAYRNPDQMPEGAVLVVGAGSSGVQIAEELLDAGKAVYLSVGAHQRPPRAYRGRDFSWWLGALGKWDTESPSPGAQHVTIAVSGAHGGRTVDFRRLAERGLILVGSTLAYQDGVVMFAPDLGRNLAGGDAYLLSVLDEADAYVARNGLDFPDDPDARRIRPDPACVTDPLDALDLADAGVKSIIWATGYASDYSWIKADVLDETGRPRHQRGIASEIGLYFLGLPWLTRRGSSFIWGVWHDAKHIADHIASRQRYVAQDAIYRGRQRAS